MPHRIATDEKDRMDLWATLAGLINPLDMSQIEHHRELVNIYTVEYSENDSTIHCAAEIGKDQHKKFEGELPGGFHATISRQVTPMKPKRRHVSPQTTAVVNTDVIFSRILGHLNSGRVPVSIDEVLATELAPIPVTLVDEKQSILRSTTKAKLKNDLPIEATGQRMFDIVISDASAILRNLPWPGKGGLVADFIKTCRQHVEQLLLEYSKVYFVFDRYFRNSIKDEERLFQSKGITRTFVLNPGVEMPSQKIIMSVIKNKVQLINLIVSSLQEDPIISKNCLILTGSAEVPYKIQDGIVTQYHLLRTSNEEADVIIVNQLLWAVRDKEAANVLIVCDDTDVFILLLHYYCQEGLRCCVMMQGPNKGRKLIDIGMNAAHIKEKLKIDPKNLLALHALSGNDTVAACLGIGKGKALKVLREHSSLNFDLVGDLTCNFDALYSMSVQFFSLCYGVKPEDNQSSIIPTRVKVWYRKVSTATRANPALQKLPPTDNSLRANVKRAHFQAAIWRSCNVQDPPQQSPELFGWFESEGRFMLPKFFDTTPTLAPEELLKLIRCQCKVLLGRCTHSKCSCKEADAWCTKFCGCSTDGIYCDRFQLETDPVRGDNIGVSADQFTDIDLSSSDEDAT